MAITPIAAIDAVSAPAIARMSSGIALRSWSAIRDGQLSTGLIAFVLFSMGTNVFKGFGSMLIVTMLITLFFNVPLTRMLLHMFYNPTKK